VMLGEELEWVVDTSSRLIAQHPLFRNRYELEGSLVFALYDLERVDDARARAEQHWVCAESDEGRIFAATVLSEVDWMAGDDLSVMQRAIGVRPLGDAWFGMRFLTELAGFHAAVQLGTAFEPQLPGLVLPLHWAGLNEIEGLRRWVAGDIAGALAALDEAADGWLDVAIPRWAVRVLGASAVLARRARTSDSAKRWEHAVATAERFGIRHHLRRWDDSGSGLTRREEQVLRLVATGRTSTEIATELGIAPRTVDDHVESARQKLGAPTRRAAVRRIVGR